MIAGFLSTSASTAHDIQVLTCKKSAPQHSTAECVKAVGFNCVISLTRASSKHLFNLFPKPHTIRIGAACVGIQLRIRWNDFGQWCVFCNHNFLRMLIFELSHHSPSTVTTAMLLSMQDLVSLELSWILAIPDDISKWPQGRKDRDRRFWIFSY